MCCVVFFFGGLELSELVSLLCTVEKLGIADLTLSDR